MLVYNSILLVVFRRAVFFEGFKAVLIVLQNDKIRSKKDRRYKSGSESESGTSSNSENEANEPAPGWLFLLLIDISIMLPLPIVMTM